MPRKRADLPELYTLDQLRSCSWVESIVPAVNRALGGRGIPRKGIVETYGVESGGKTTIALTFQPDYYIDLERSLEPDWAAKFAPAMKVAYAWTLEEAFNLVEHLAKSKPRVVALDSLGGGLAEKELDTNQQAAQSQATSRWLRKLINTNTLDETVLLVVNQLRSSFDQYGPPTTTPGGRVLRHLALMRIDVRRSGLIEVGERKVGQTILVRVTKSKVSAPWSEGEIHLAYDGTLCETEAEVKERMSQRGNRGSAARSIEEGGAR